MRAEDQQEKGQDRGVGQGEQGQNILSYKFADVTTEDWRLRALAENPGFCSHHTQWLTTGYNPSSRVPLASATHNVHRYTCRRNTPPTHTHKMKENVIMELISLYDNEVLVASLMKTLPVRSKKLH